MKSLFLILMTALFSSHVFALNASLVSDRRHGEYLANLNGRKGLLICLHGSGGSARGWILNPQKKAYLERFQKAGYGILCPTSKNRTTKKWNSKNSGFNEDIKNIESLLSHRGISLAKKIFLVGHSNGGGFVSRFTAFSNRASKVKAVHYANSSGIEPILESRLYQAPSFFGYAICDSVVNYSKVMNNSYLLMRKLGLLNVRTKDQDVLVYWRRLDSCHEFVNISGSVLNFFSKY